MNISELISERTVKVPLKAESKHAAIDELVDLIDDAGLVRDADQLKRVVWERELQRSTGIGEGLGIPHGKCDCTDRLVMAIGIPTEPIDFDAIDRKPVSMIVLLISPPNRTGEHIQALGKISRLMSRVDFRERAYAAKSPEELVRLFAETEQT